MHPPSRLACARLLRFMPQPADVHAHPSPQRGVEGYELPGLCELAGLRLWRAACVVALPGAGLWAACGGFCTEAVCMRAGTATSWRTAARASRPTTAQATRADTIRKRLGWGAGILNGNGGKPKGMHWATFERLQAVADGKAKDRSERAMCQKHSRSAWLGLT